MFEFAVTPELPERNDSWVDFVKRPDIELTNAAFEFSCLVEEHELGATNYASFGLLLLVADEDVHADSGFLWEL